MKSSKHMKSMTFQDIFNLEIQKGIENDFRSKHDIDRVLKRHTEEYQKLEGPDKDAYDTEKLHNPYSDTRILNGNPKVRVRKVLVGIDMEPSELLLAKQLGDIDLVIAHHPEGIGLAGLDEVMEYQVDIMAQYGVPVNVAQHLLHERIEEVNRGISPINHNRAVDIARMLGINYMCVHTPTDNMVAQFLRKRLEQNNEIYYVKDVLDVLKAIPEYAQAMKHKAGPTLFAGKPSNRAGRVALTELTGGTEGSAEMYERLAQAGIGTIVGMHMSENHTKAVRKAHVNAVIAGHMSSDSLGMNLFLDELEKQGVEIVAVSGLTRFSRVSGAQQ